MISVSIFYLIVSASGQLESFENHFKDSSLGKVQIRETDSFKISWVHPRDEIVVDALLKHIEKADLELSTLFRNASGKHEKVPIEIFPDLKSFSEVSQLSLARFKATGTIALTLDQRLMLLSPRNLFSGYPWAVTVVHEYIHYLIRRISLEHIPIWLHEGVAQLYQGFPYEKKASLRPAQWGLFKKYKSQSKLLSLDTLREPFPYRKNPEEAELAYIQALLFVQWLDSQCGAVQLIRWAEDLEGLDPALQKCTKLSTKQLSDQFIPRILGKVAIPEGSDVAYFARDFSGKDPSEMEGQKTDRNSRNIAQLSAKLFDQGRYRASNFEMEKAIQKTPAPPPSWRRQLAVGYERAGEVLKTDKVLKKLVSDYPEDAGGWFLLGQRRIAEKNAPDAWQAFVRAFFVNPFLEGLEEQLQTLKEKNPQFDYVLPF